MNRCDACAHYRVDPYRVNICVRGAFSRPTSFERHPQGACGVEGKFYISKANHEAEAASRHVHDGIDTR